eukprot:gene19586-biopygen6177
METLCLFDFVPAQRDEVLNPDLKQLLQISCSKRERPNVRNTEDILSKKVSITLELTSLLLADSDSLTTSTHNSHSRIHTWAIVLWQSRMAHKFVSMSEESRQKHQRQQDARVQP